MDADFEVITFPIEYNVTYCTDFTDCMWEYLGRKMVLESFCQNSLDCFDTEEDVFFAYADLIQGIVTGCNDVVDVMSTIILESNGMETSERMVCALSERMVEPISQWIEEVSFVDLARVYLSSYRLEPLLKGRVRKGFFKK